MAHSQSGPQDTLLYLLGSRLASEMLSTCTLFMSRVPEGVTLARIVIINPKEEEGQKLQDLAMNLGHRVVLSEDYAGAKSSLSRADLVIASAAVAEGPKGLLAKLNDGSASLKVAWTATEQERPLVVAIGRSAVGFLYSPVRAAQVYKLLEQLFPDHKPLRWTGEGFLERVHGTSKRFPPLRVLFLIHRVGGTGRLRVRTKKASWSIDFKNGKILNCAGMPGLLGEGYPGDDLMSQLGAAIGGGMLPHEAMEQAAIGIGESVARISVDQRGAVDFDSDAPAPKQPMMLPTALSRVIAEGLEKAHGIDRVRRRLDGHARATLTVVPPDGSASSEWGLPALALRLVREIGRGIVFENLMELLDDGEVDRGWRMIDLMLQLGLLHIESPTTGAVVVDLSEEDSELDEDSWNASPAEESFSVSSFEDASKDAPPVQEADVGFADLGSLDDLGDLDDVGGFADLGAVDEGSEFVDLGVGSMEENASDVIERFQAEADDSTMNEQVGVHSGASTQSTPELSPGSVEDPAFDLSDEEDLFGDIEALLEDFDLDLGNDVPVASEAAPPTAPAPEPTPASEPAPEPAVETVQDQNDEDMELSADLLSAIDAFDDLPEIDDDLGFEDFGTIEELADGSDAEQDSERPHAPATNFDDSRGQAHTEPTGGAEHTATIRSRHSRPLGVKSTASATVAPKSSSEPADSTPAAAPSASARHDKEDSGPKAPQDDPLARLRAKRAAAKAQRRQESERSRSPTGDATTREGSARQTVAPSSTAKQSGETSNSKELTEFLNRSTDAEPWEIMGLERSRDCNEGALTRKYREMSQRYHPDRYINADKRSQQVAAEVFTLITEAYETLSNPGILEEVEQILVAKEEGRTYVSRADRQRARLAYKKAEVLYRQKRFEGSLEQVNHAQSLDPTDWRFQSLSIQVQQKMGSLEPAEAAKALVGIEGAKGKERASVLYTAAELLIRSGDDEQAYELFTQVTELDEDHVGAKRRLRLRDMRNK